MNLNNAGLVRNTFASLASIQLSDTSATSPLCGVTTQGVTVIANLLKTIIGWFK
jgi:hypothetical protein